MITRYSLTDQYRQPPFQTIAHWLDKYDCWIHSERIGHYMQILGYWTE